MGNQKNHLNLSLCNQRETLSIKPSIHCDLDSKWLFGLTVLEEYNFIFNRTTENIKSEL